MDEQAAQSMTELANAAFREAAKKVIRRAIETNTPVIVYEDGKLLKLDPRTIQLFQSDTTSDPQTPGNNQVQE